MSDLRASERIAPWLEMELARSLRPVPAPESLWDRIEERRFTTTTGSARWTLWPVAAVLMLMAAGATAWRLNRPFGPAEGMQGVAMEQLRGLPAGLDFQSADPAEIRSWVKAKTDIDIDLPASLPAGGAVRLLGARVIRRHGLPFAAVAYDVGRGAATLLVSRALPARSVNTAAPQHSFAKVEPGAGVFSWSMRQQVYVLATSVVSDPQVACLLCHAGAPRRTTFN